MHRYKEKQISPYQATDLFDLVMDITRYPEFLPWCRAARILEHKVIIEQKEGKVIGELVISFKHITESYTSEIIYKRPTINEAGYIDVKMLKGPFASLENHWKFTPLANQSCEIYLDLSFQFKSRILDSIIGLLFGKACAKMVNAFKQRADNICVLTKNANAKINLYLHINGKTEHNYHLLDSMVVFADIYDVISVKKSDKLSLNIKNNLQELPINEENIIIKTAKLLQNHFNIKNQAEITLLKNLPVSAGIGGGSADAASTMCLLSKLWNLENRDLSKIALQIGADVPVCFQNKACFVSGIGDEIKIIQQMPLLYVVLVNNNKELITKDVFANYQPKFTPALLNKPNIFTNVNELISFLKQNKNDLQDVAIKLMPEISVMLNILSADNNCLFAQMSGSGATCFGLFENQNDAIIASEKIKNNYPDWWVASGKIV
jgi:4-diphosphocytidyl-2-C-methyl-D-erythritol kinase